MAKKKKKDADEVQEEAAPEVASTRSASSGDPTVNELFELFKLDQYGIQRDNPGILAKAELARRLTQCDHAVAILALILGITGLPVDD